jgi:hypothetical protein
MLRLGISEADSMGRMMPWVDTRWRIMFSWKGGMVPVIRILAVESDVSVGRVLVVEARRTGFGGGVVHHMPKLAMDLYMYFAGLVNDKVGVT